LKQVIGIFYSLMSAEFVFVSF